MWATMARSRTASSISKTRMTVGKVSLDSGLRVPGAVETDGRGLIAVGEETGKRLPGSEDVKVEGKWNPDILLLRLADKYPVAADVDSEVETGEDMSVIIGISVAYTVVYWVTVTRSNGWDELAMLVAVGLCGTNTVIYWVSTTRLDWWEGSAIVDFCFWY